MIREAINEACEVPNFKVYFLFDLDIDVKSELKFPSMRADRYQPDYHAGSIETAQMITFFPEKVRHDIAENLLPQDSFHPFAYCGDPASYELKLIL